MATFLLFVRPIQLQNSTVFGVVADRKIKLILSGSRMITCTYVQQHTHRHDSTYTDTAEKEERKEEEQCVRMWFYQQCTAGGSLLTHVQYLQTYSNYTHSVLTHVPLPRRLLFRNHSHLEKRKKSEYRIRKKFKPKYTLKEHSEEFMKMTLRIIIKT